MRFFFKFIATISTLSALLLVILLGTLSTSQGLPLVTQLVNLATPYYFIANQLEFQWHSPRQWTFHHPKLYASKDLNQAPIFDATALSFTLSPFSEQQTAWSFEQMTIKGTALTPLLQNRPQTPFKITSLALDDVDIQFEDWTINSAAIQLNHWQNDRKLFGQWQGDWQFSAPQMSIRDHQLTNLLFHGHKDRHAFSMNGFSFHSPFGNFTGKADIHNNTIRVFHLTLSDSKIESAVALDELKQAWEALNEAYQVYVERWDLLNVSTVSGARSVEKLNLSLKEVGFYRGHWQFNAKSQLSFHAETMQFDEVLFVDILGDLQLKPDVIKVEGLSTKFDEGGYLTFSGQFSPLSFHFDQLTLNGVDLHLPHPAITTLANILPTQVSFDELALQHINLQAANPRFPMQWLGVNLKGHDLVIAPSNLKAAFSGDIEFSAAYASLNRQPVGATHFQLKTKNKHLIFDPIDISFQNGQIIGSASLDSSNSSLPWTLALSGLNVPSNLYQQWLDLDVPITGKHDLELQLTGLARGLDSLRYSVMGNIILEPVFSQWQNKNPIAAHLQQFLNGSSKATLDDANLEIGKINASIDRGHVTLAPVTIKTEAVTKEMTGNWDFVTEQGQFDFRSITEK